MEKTNNYSMFKKHESNRTLDESNLRTIMASIKARNLLEFRPIIVNSNFQVIDGQHRLEAAMRLGLEVYYIINRDTNIEDMILLNVNQKKWSQDDYLNHYVSLGKPDYIKLVEFRDKNGFTTREVSQYFNHKGGSELKAFKMGCFKFPVKEKLDIANLLIDRIREITEMINKFKIDGDKVTIRFKFKDALIEFLGYEDVDYDLLKKKISLNLDKIRECHNTSAYLIMLRDVYNWKNKNPLMPFGGNVAQLVRAADS